MAKLPDLLSLGGTPNIGGARPIASIDASPIAKGAEAIGAAVGQGGQAIARAVGEGGREIGAARAAVGKATEQLGEADISFGKGIGALGEGLQNASIDWQRSQYAQAHSDFLSKRIDLDQTYAKDQDWQTLPQRYAEDLNKLRDQSAQLVSPGPMRDRFISDTTPQLTQSIGHAQNQARSLQGNAAIAGVETQGNKFIDQASSISDPDTRNQIVTAHSANIDNLQARGFITPVQAVQMKQTWAHQYAIADGLTRSETDPQGVINDLRAAPGSDDATINRIIHAESGGNATIRNPRSSATGAGQFIDSTWLDLIKRYRPDLAKGQSDQDLLDMRSDPKLSRDMVGKLLEQNRASLKSQGVDDSPANLYLAHFLGAKAAAAVAQADPKQPVALALASSVGPKAAAAMIQANPEVLAGKQVGTVTDWAAGKMGGAQTGGVHLYDILRPDQRAMLLTHAEGQLNKQHASDLSGLNARVSDTTAEAYNTGIAKNPVSQAEFISALGPQKGQAAFQSYQGELRLAGDIQRVAGMSREDQDKLLESYTPQSGPGYADAAKRQDALEKEVDKARDQQLRSDQVPAKLGPMTPEEQAALVAGYQPKGSESPEDLKQLGRQASLMRAIAHVNKQRDDDPAAYAVRYLPAAQDAWQKLSATVQDGGASDADKQAAARDYATKTQIEQTRIGVPAEAQRIVPQTYVDHLSDALTNAAANDDPAKRVALVGQVQREAAMWGDAWPSVMRQLAPAAQPVVRAIAAGADPGAMTRLLSLDKGETPAKIVGEQNDTKIKDVQAAVNTAMQPFLATLVGRQKDRDYPGYVGLAEKLTALDVRDGKSPSDAAAGAFKALIGGRYDFRDTWRIPKSSGVSADDVQQGTVEARAQIAAAAQSGADAFGIVPFRNDIGVENNRSDSLSKFARDGRLITAADNAGLNLVYDNDRIGQAFVRRADGRPVVLTWGELAGLAKGARARAGETAGQQIGGI